MELDRIINNVVVEHVQLGNILHDTRHGCHYFRNAHWEVSTEKETWLLMFYQNA